MKNFYKTERIDAHEHVWANVSEDLLLTVMDTLHISRMVLCATGLGPDHRGYEANQEKALALQQKYPERFIALATGNHTSSSCCKSFVSYLEKGAQGLKLMNGHYEYKYEPLGSKRMIPLYKICEKQGLPVLIHLNLATNPGQTEEFQQVLDRFPALTVVLAHFGILYRKLDELARLLNRNPNLMVDSSMGRSFSFFLKDVDWDPGRYRDFFCAFEDRIVWGSDQVIAAATTQKYLKTMMRAEFSLLEEKQYTTELDYFPQSRPVFGLGLPASVLEKVYLINPKRIYG